MLLLVVLTTCGCRTHRIKSPVAVPALARVARTETLWRVEEPGHEGTRGYVVFFRSEGTSRDSVYVVRNRWHQDLGMVDGLGRAYRYRPHQEEAEWLGTGTLVEGVTRILDLEGPPVLVEEPISHGGTPRAAVSPSEAQVTEPAPATDGAQKGTS